MPRLPAWLGNFESIGSRSSSGRRLYAGVAVDRAHPSLGSSPSAPPMIQKIEFAPDSPLEGNGFELLVPREISSGFEAFGRVETDRPSGSSSVSGTVLTGEPGSHQTHRWREQDSNHWSRWRHRASLRLIGLLDAEAVDHLRSEYSHDVRHDWTRCIETTRPKWSSH